MKALVYEGPYDIRVEEKDRPEIQAPDDIILRVTTTAICGSDLHLYHGAIESLKPGQTLGHEFMGIVDQAGPEVHEVEVGDRVVIPFNVCCGRCWYCRNQLWSQCDRSNPKAQLGAAFGYGEQMGGYDGGQAEYVRVPFANAMAMKVPESLSDEDVIFLSDILPTGYFGTDLADVSPGDDVAVFGAGPVGYFAVISAYLRGAARVFSIDRWPRRLDLTAEIGAEPIRFDKVDPVEAIKEETKGLGAICIDAVGFEAINPTGQPQSDDTANEPIDPVQVLTWISQCARRFSTVGIPGVYTISLDNFPMGMFFNRELHLKMGQCPVMKYAHRLLHLIECGRINPKALISHTMSLEEGPNGYDIFNKKEATKVILKTENV